MKWLFLVLFLSSCAGCSLSGDLEEKFVQAKNLKANQAFCFDVEKPESIKGHYCLEHKKKH